jgi:hypothetical protein
MSTTRKNSVGLDPVPEIMSRISHNGNPAEDIHDKLLKVWEGCMSKGEYDAWCRCLQGEADATALPPAVFDKLNKLILHQAETVGWRMESSLLVRDRFRAWEMLPNGPELFEQYWKACALALRYQRGEVPPPIRDPYLPQFKDDTVAELKKLLSLLRDHFAQSFGPITTEALVQRWNEFVFDPQLELIHLQNTIGAWVQYLRIDGSALGEQYTRIDKTTLDDMTPGALFDSWWGWCKRRSPETARQEVCKIGSALKAAEHTTFPGVLGNCADLSKDSQIPPNHGLGPASSRFKRSRKISKG